MINFLCVDSFGKELRSNHFSSGSTTSFSDSHPSLTSFETSDSLLEEFTDELALLDLYKTGTMRYVVPTGRVVVPTGRYVVPAGKVIFIVSPSRLNLVIPGGVK
ncbi:hypothetical protein Tco_0257223 [Tanacetum coccineum]